MCFRWCAYGYAKDDNGCDICDCVEPTGGSIRGGILKEIGLLLRWVEMDRNGSTWPPNGSNMIERGPWVSVNKYPARPQLTGMQQVGPTGDSHTRKPLQVECIMDENHDSRVILSLLVPFGLFYLDHLDPFSGIWIFLLEQIINDVDPHVKVVHGLQWFYGPGYTQPCSYGNLKVLPISKFLKI